MDMSTNLLPIGTIVTIGGVTGRVVGTGTVHRDDTPTPQWMIRTPTGTVRVTGNEIYSVEVAA